MKVILVGASGRMGAQMLALLQAAENIEVVAVDNAYRTDCAEHGLNAVMMYGTIADVEENADVIVDFSLHTATREVVNFAVRKGIPLVLATTGHTDDERACAVRASEDIPVFMASNMAIAIAHIKTFCAKLATVFPDADIEIIEAHHSKKMDSPSGTALSIANGIVKERNFGKVVVGRGGERVRGEVNVHSLRLGRSLGEHAIVIDTGKERITVVHETFSRAVYAEGAMRAMHFIVKKERGLFGIEDLI